MRIKNAHKGWKQLKATSGFKTALSLLVFIGIAAAFWFVVAMNDNVQDTMKVNIQFYNLPDSVTFITEPPKSIKVTVRDKGTSLLRTTGMRTPSIIINFKEFANQGKFLFPSASLYDELRNTFGNNALFTSVSIDSISFAYTTNPGRRVPIMMNAEFDATSGNYVGTPQLSQKYAMLYAADDSMLDTIKYVTTRRLVKTGLQQSSDFPVTLEPISGVRIIPDTVNIRVPVEKLVSKHLMVPINVVNLPQGRSVLLFPSKAEVTCYVPMSKFDDQKIDITVDADYQHASPKHSRIPIHISHHGSGYINLALSYDSVEYTLVK